MGPQQQPQQPNQIQQLLSMLKQKRDQFIQGASEFGQSFMSGYNPQPQDMQNPLSGHALGQVATNSPGIGMGDDMLRMLPMVAGFAGKSDDMGRLLGSAKNAVNDVFGGDNSVAESVLSIVKNNKKYITKVTPDELKVLTKEVENIPFTQDAKIHLDPIKDYLLKNSQELSREEFSKLHPNVDKLLSKFSSGKPQGVPKGFLNKKVNISNIENPAGFDNPKNLAKYDRDAIDYLKQHPEELNKPIEVSAYGREDKKGNLTHFIENGQHRYQALKEMGVKDINVFERQSISPKGGVKK